jgi:hypothetical protein
LLASAVGMVAVWFSHPSVFILAALGLGSLWNFVRKKESSSLSILLAPFVSWAASFALFYLASLRRLIHDQALLEYWHKVGAFAPFPPKNLAQLRWYLETPFQLFADPGGMDLPDVAALAWVFGCFALWRKNRPQWLVLVVPALLPFLASTIHKYPFQGRLLLFLVPLMLLGVGEGAAAIIRGTKKTVPLFRAAFLAILFLYPVFEAAYHLTIPRRSQEVRPLISQLKEEYREGDTLYVHPATHYTFSYYALREHLDNMKPIFGPWIGGRSWASYVINEVQTLRGRERVWFLFSGRLDSDGVNQEELFVAYLNRVGKKVQAFQSKGASVYLYDLRL